MVYIEKTIGKAIAIGILSFSPFLSHTPLTKWCHALIAMARRLFVRRLVGPRRSRGADADGGQVGTEVVSSGAWARKNRGIFWGS